MSRKVLEPAQVLRSLSMRPSYCGFRRWALVLTVLLAASAAAAAEPAFARWTTSARWEMNEGPTAVTMRDSSAADRDGSIGDDVVTGVTSGDFTVYEWPDADLSIENPERLVRVPSSGLNPRRADYLVTVRFRTNAPDQNIIQKGQAASPGLWKIELNNGRAFCFFKGAGGRGSIGSASRVDDGDWHTVKCVRRPNSVSITVDGGGGRTIERTTGRIANAADVAIGGKLFCNPANNVSCQYYVGMIDRAVIKRRSR